MRRVCVWKKRGDSATLTAAPDMNAAIHGKVSVTAALTAAGHMTPTPLNARRRAGADMNATTQFLPAIGRMRPVCVALNAGAQMNAATTRVRRVQVPLVAGAAVAVTVRKRAQTGVALSANTATDAGQTLPLQRRRNVSAAMSMQPTAEEVFLRKRAFASTHMTATPGASFGRDSAHTWRILEDGSPRVTQGHNRRLIEESFDWGNIIVVYPPFKIFNNKGGLWYVLKPSAKAGNWQLPQAISVHWQGGWRDVKSNK